MAIDIEKCMALLELIERLENLRAAGRITNARADAGVTKANTELDQEFVE